MKQSSQPSRDRFDLTEASHSRSSIKPSKVQHVLKVLPAVRAIFNTINRVLGIRQGLKTVFIRKNNKPEKSISGFQILLREAHREPTKCKQLVTVGSHFVGVMGAAKEGMRGVVVGKMDTCASTVFCLEWPQGVQDMVCTKDNPDGPITNSDLDMAGLLLCWLVMEEAAMCLCHKHVGLYCDNSVMVSCVSQRATLASKVVGPLVMALALRLKARQASR